MEFDLNGTSCLSGGRVAAAVADSQASTKRIICLGENTRILKCFIING